MLVDRHRQHGLQLGRLQEFLRAARAAVRLPGEVSVCLTGDATMRRMNRQYRGLDAPTDVLSFPADEPPGPDGAYAGDVVISLDTAGRQARRLRHSLATEVRILMLHGLLHLSGMDHETDRGQMRRRETALRRRLGLPAGLIERASPRGRTGRGEAPTSRRA